MLKIHKLAEIFPPMIQDEFESLKKSIHCNGQEVPIKVLKSTNEIIDGRHRYKAWQELNIEPLIEWIEDDLTEERLRSLIIKLNLDRRHLTPSQKAWIAAGLANIEKGHFHGNQYTKTLNSGIGNSADTKLLLGPTQSEIAKCFGLSERTIRQAKKIRREAPELNNHIYVGDIKIDDACRLLSEAPAVRCQVLQRFNEDKSLNKKTKKLCQYKNEIVKEQAQFNIEKAIANNFVTEVSEQLLVQPGETWQLGRHKLTCCDSSTWNPPYAKLAFADPPYNCGIAEWDFHFEWKHDWLIDKADLVLVTPGDESLAGFLKKTEMPYRCTISHWIKNGMSKGAMGYGNHILGLVFCKESTPYKVTGVRNQSFSTGVIKLDETNNTNHPGRKPLDFLVTWIEKLTKPGDFIIDPFLGSGTTLFAADETNRTFCGAEISTKYCTEIIGRWLLLNKEKPLKI